MKLGEHSSVRFQVMAALVLVASGVMGILVLREYEPTDASWYPKCTFHQLTGLHCPGCGSTRAVHALVNGQFVTAVRSNLLLMVGGPVLAVLLWRQRRRDQSGESTSPRLAWSLCAIVILYFVGRNLPSPSRSWLAPPSKQSAMLEADATANLHSESQTGNRP